MDGTEVPPVRLTPARRPRTAAQERAARETAATASTQPEAQAEGPPVKAQARGVTKKLAPARKQPIPVAPTPDPTPEPTPEPVAEAPAAVKKAPAAKVVSKPEAPQPTNKDEAPKPASRSWSTPTAPVPAAPVRSPLDDLPPPVPGVPVTKTHVAAVVGLLSLWLLRRKRRKRHQAKP